MVAVKVHLHTWPHEWEKTRNSAVPLNHSLSPVAVKNRQTQRLNSHQEAEREPRLLGSDNVNI